MAPRASVHECGPVTSELAELRLLTEVMQLRANLDEEGNVPLGIQQDVQQNLQTAVAEISMPYAVTTTVHRVEYHTDQQGRPRRVITWLGKNAIDVAMGGRAFHFSEAAKQRVDIEVKEAKYAQKYLRDDIAQVFISPKMSIHDAAPEIAKAEHLADEDSIRVSTPIVDVDGTIVGRKMQSLLVRDIPLSAWVTMLKDPHNIFGKTFEIRDDQSALPIMELFSKLELPETDLPNGPVDIVAAVASYITDDIVHAKVHKQLDRFRTDQELYRKEAVSKANEWYHFDLELARSLEKGEATYDIRRFIITLQHEWDDAELAVVCAHEKGDTMYDMSEELAATLEKKKRLLLGRVAAVVTNNDLATQTITAAEKQQIIFQHNKILQAELHNVPQAEVLRLRANMDRRIARTNIKVGGGCVGDVSNENDQSKPEGLDQLSLDGVPKESNSENDKTKWKWKKGVCQVKACPSPKPTEVGPCSVCRHCQAEFDRGKDPTKNTKPTSHKQVARTTGFAALSGSILKDRTTKKPKEEPRRDVPPRVKLEVVK